MPKPQSAPSYGNKGASCMDGCIIKCLSPHEGGKGQNKWPGFARRLAQAPPEEDRALKERFAWLCDDIGVDTFAVAGTLAAIQDAGLLAKNDAARALTLVEEIGQNTEMGRLLGSGCATQALEPGRPMVEKKTHNLAAHGDESLLNDILGLCRFAAHKLQDNPAAQAALADMLAAKFGIEFQWGDLQKLSRRVEEVEKEFNRRARRPPPV